MGAGPPFVFSVQRGKEDDRDIIRPGPDARRKGESGGSRGASLEKEPDWLLNAELPELFQRDRTRGVLAGRDLFLQLRISVGFAMVPDDQQPSYHRYRAHQADDESANRTSRVEGKNILLPRRNARSMPDTFA